MTSDNPFIRTPNQTLYNCPCCGLPTLPDRNCYDLCIVCLWEDDGQDDHDADVVRGGPNGDISLTQARENYKHYGVSDPLLLKDKSST